MSSFLKNLEIILNSGDPEIRTWFLIRHNYLPFILCGFYVLFSTLIGPAIMKNRKPYDLRKVMIFFNFSLVATYITCITIGFWYWSEIPLEEFCKGTQVRKGDVRYTMARAGWMIYILKYIEFLDTIFFVLRKKQNQITFLHVGHHTIVPIVGWIIIRSENSGMQVIPGLINSFVHIIMYTYYGLAAMGPSVRKYLWWKKYLTQLQMIQFLLIILFVTVIAPFSGCKMLISSYIIDIFIAPTFLFLFYNFYKASFQNKNKSIPINKDSKTNSSKKELHKKQN